jgi:hypothetical protein
MIPRLKAQAALVALNPIPESERVKGNAAGFGTRLHRAIEAHLKGTPKPVPADVQEAFDLWLSWWGKSGLTAVHIERRVGCAACGYGGTADCIAADPQGRLYLIDWKSSKRISDNYALQLSAYGHAFEQDGPQLAGGIVVRVGKTKRSKVDPKRFTALDMRENFIAFQHALAVWRWQRTAAGEDAGDAPLGGH